LYSTLFGAFQLIDLHINDSNEGGESSLLKESYVDFGFGSDTSSFAGVHRFAVHRSRPTGDRSDLHSPIANVKITYSSFTCNPSKNIPIKPFFLSTLHMIYAMLLFREGIAQILS